MKKRTDVAFWSRPALGPVSVIPSGARAPRLHGLGNAAEESL